MPWASLPMNTVVLLDDLAVVGKAVPTELEGAFYTCDGKPEASQQQAQLGWLSFAYLILPGTSKLSAAAVDCMIALPGGVAAPAELKPALDTYERVF